MNMGGWTIEYYGTGPYIISKHGRRVEVHDVDALFERLFRTETDAYELVKMLLADLVELTGRVSDLERNAK